MALRVHAAPVCISHASEPVRKTRRARQGVRARNHVRRGATRAPHRYACCASFNGFDGFERFAKPTTRGRKFRAGASFARVVTKSWGSNAEPGTLTIMVFPTRRPRAMAREVLDRSAVRPLSETVLDFGTPLLRELPDGVDLSRIHTVLAHVIETWNALVLAEQGRTRAFQSAVRDASAPFAGQDKLHALTLLATRRAEHFTHDHRLVQQWTLQLDPVDPAGLRLVTQPAPATRPRDGAWGSLAWGACPN
jgi:hypothetical protein